MEAAYWMSIFSRLFICRPFHPWALFHSTPLFHVCNFILRHRLLLPQFSNPVNHHQAILNISNCDLPPFIHSFLSSPTCWYLRVRSFDHPLFHSSPFSLAFNSVYSFWTFSMSFTVDLFAPFQCILPECINSSLVDPCSQPMIRYSTYSAYIHPWQTHSSLILPFISSRIQCLQNVVSLLFLFSRYGIAPPHHKLRTCASSTGRTLFRPWSALEGWRVASYTGHPLKQSSTGQWIGLTIAFRDIGSSGCYTLGWFTILSPVACLSIHSSIHLIVFGTSVHPESIRLYPVPPCIHRRSVHLAS